MKILDVNIGLVIEQKLNELDMSKSEFGRKIGIPQQNVNRILDKASIDTERLVKISEALDYNFFQEFRGDTDVGQRVETKGDYSPASFNGDAHVEVGADAVNAAVLEERVKSLQALLDEKERTIRILMEGRK